MTKYRPPIPIGDGKYLDTEGKLHLSIDSASIENERIMDAEFKRESRALEEAPYKNELASKKIRAYEEQNKSILDDCWNGFLAVTIILWIIVAIYTRSYLVCTLALIWIIIGVIIGLAIQKISKKTKDRILITIIALSLPVAFGLAAYFTKH